MPTDLGWFMPDGTTPSGAITVNPVNGVPGPAFERHLFNDQDASGDDDTEDFLVTAMSANVGETPSFDDELAANGWIEFRLIGYGGTGMVAQTTGWNRVGRGRFVRVKGIKAEGWREFEVRPNVPIGAGVVAKDVKLRVVEGQRAIALEMGHYEAGSMGIRLGLGDPTFTEVLTGFEITPNGTPDNTVDVAKGIIVHEGVPIADMDETHTLDNLDANAAALASGEEYLVRFSRGETNATTKTKGVKGTAPLSLTALPDLPDGHRDIGFVRVPFDAIIDTGEIDQSLLIYGAAYLEGTTLSPYIHPFEMMVGNNYVVSPSAFEITLTDNDVNYIWVQPNGDVKVNVTGLQPEDRSMLIYEVTTSGGAITAVKDCRIFIYPNPVEVVLHQADVLVADDRRYGVLPCACQAYLVPIGGIVASLGVPGTVSGGTKWDLNASQRGAAFSSIFPSSGTQDERPEVAHDAAEPLDTEAFPETFSFQGYTRFESDVLNIPGGSDAAGATIRMKFSAAASVA